MISTAAMPKSFTKNQVRNYNLKLISQMIGSVAPEINKKRRDQISISLYQSSKKYAIDPKIMIAIIDTESDFYQGAVSSTGDLSMAQINTDIWNREFVRLGLDQINIKLLKKDEAYALGKMGKILNILKKRHAGKDANWFARYHSHTKSLKNLYGAKVQKKLKTMAMVTVASM